MNMDFVVLDKEIMCDSETVEAVTDLLYPGFDFEETGATWGIATVDDVAIGAIGFLEDFPAQLVWLYVIPDYRRRGVGTFLINSIKNYLEEKLIISEIYTQFDIDANDEQCALYYFFDSIENTDILMENDIYEVEPEQIQKSVLNNVIFREQNTDNVKRIDDLSKDQLKDILSQYDIADIFECKHFDSYYDTFQKDISLYTSDIDGVDSLVLMSQLDKTTLIIDLIYTKKPMKLFTLINELGRTVAADYPECSVVFRPINDKIYGLMEYIFEEVRIRSYNCTAVLNC